MNPYALEEANMTLVTCFSCGQSGETSTSAQSLLLLDVTVMTLEMSGRGHSEIPNENQTIMKEPIGLLFHGYRCHFAEYVSMSSSVGCLSN